MATDKVTIWNLALSAAGSTSSVSDPNESSREANLCRLWYDLVRDNVLKAAPWPSAKTTSRLTLKATRDFAVDWVDTDPSPSFMYSYKHPTGMLAPRFLSTWSPFDNSWSSGYSENILSTNQKNAVLTYTFRQDDVSMWDMALQSTIVETLGATLAQPLSGKVSLSERLIERARDRILTLKADVANEQDVTYDRVPEGLVVRGFDAPVSQTRYHYPFEELLIGNI